MSECIEIRGVILGGADLNPVNGPWRSIVRANNLRLVPIVAGVVVAMVALAILDASLSVMVAALAPILLAWYAFIWLTNSHYMVEYKRAYSSTPTGGVPCDFAFDTHGMKQAAPGLAGQFNWSCFAEITEDKGAFRFWLTPFMAVVLPKRFARDGQEEALRQLIADARARGEIKSVGE